MQGIRLIHGVSVKDIKMIGRQYRLLGGTLELTLSAEDYGSFFDKAVGMLKEPVFFFIETPKSPDSEEYETYYLDNCTLPVAKAILKRYSGILYSDGVIRFGFGSHISGDEIYMQEYQLVRIYSDMIPGYEKIVRELGYERNDGTKTIWDVLSDKNVGERESVECDDETYADIIENLSELGMYMAK